MKYIYTERERMARAARYRENAAAIVAQKRERRWLTRKRAMIGLGGRCACCGESNSLFLTIEHLNGHAAPQGKKRTDYHIMSLQIIRSGYDTKQFQVLCFNCNCGKNRTGGVCPHQLKVAAGVGEDGKRC